MKHLGANHRIFLSLVLATLLGMGMTFAQPPEGTPGTGPSCEASGGTSGHGAPHECDDGGVLSDSVHQDIDVKIPTVVRLVLDKDVTSDRLGNWKLNFAGDRPGKYVEHCYVLPNWVGEIETGIGFQEFLDTAGEDGLVEWKRDYGYPAIITASGSNAVKTWGDVTSNGAYLERGTDVPAKGNVACKYEFMVEKYTNLPDGASFDVELTTDSDGFGALYIEDVVKANGIDFVFGTGDASFTSAGSEHLVDIAPNHFFDDYVTQWLDLTTAQPGYHDMTLTYTLSAAVAD